MKKYNQTDIDNIRILYPEIIAYDILGEALPEELEAKWNKVLEDLKRRKDEEV